MATVRPRDVLNRLVIVCSLGYFVDIFDLLLFSIVRRQSLLDLGVAEDQLLSTGALLLNWQMAGLLLGGIAWGVLGDKRGRRTVLFGSIALYSVANLGNAFVQDVTTYAVLRFVAGIGLAGELGAAVTLVSEALPAHARGYGTMLVSSLGILGAVAAYAVARLDWRAAYIAGGVLGILLLAARLSIAESRLFETTARAGGAGSRRGDLRLFLGSFPRGGTAGDRPGFRWFRGNGDRARRLVLCALVGVPLWCAIGIHITFSTELAQSLRVVGTVDPGVAVMVSYTGASLGSLASGTLSQVLRSRRLAILGFLGFTALADGAFLLLGGAPAAAFYAACGVLGLAVGYWAVFVQTAAEQFGTDLRATVATAVPNLVRGAVVPLTLSYLALQATMSRAAAAVLLLAVTVVIAMIAAWRLKETYGRDLDFVESAPTPTPAEPQISQMSQIPARTGL